MNPASMARALTFRYPRIHFKFEWDAGSSSHIIWADQKKISVPNWWPDMRAFEHIANQLRQKSKIKWTRLERL